MALRRLLLVAAVLGLAAFLASRLTWLPSENEIRREFLKRYPFYQLVGVEIGAGDYRGRLYVITFRRSSSGPPQILVWTIRSGDFYGWTVADEAFAAAKR